MPENESKYCINPDFGPSGLAGKNLLIIDGDCGFCRRWALYFQQLALKRFEIVTSQEVSELFPQIPPHQFQESVKFIDIEGSLYHSAEACFRALALNPLFAFLMFFYRVMKPFARVSELLYRVVASNRIFFSRVTRVFWGNKVEVPHYALLQFLFLRGIGLIYLIAFLSLIPEMMGLFGAQGVMPIAGYTQMVEEALSQSGQSLMRFWYVPSVFWLGQSDIFILGVLWAGVVAALLLVLNIAPAITAAICFFLYLSICAVGSPFMSFQWDALLLEVGFLAILFAPWRFLPWRGQFAPAPSRVIVWLYRWLLFRLMFASGAVKLSSGDRVWAEGTALNYHYFTQPIPNPLSWFVHHLPEWFHRFSVGGMFFIELVVPFFIFAPRRLRFAAGIVLAFLQILILLTGNYTFFNLLSLLLILTCWDDQALEWIFGLFKRGLSKAPQSQSNHLRPVMAESFFKRIVLIPSVALLVLWMSIAPLAGSLRIATPGWVSALNSQLGQFRIVNGYGLFAMMTTERREILIEGSRDGVNWFVYEFKYKPGALNRRPSQIAPFQPRLDWQMWFAALGNYQGNPWLLNLQARLLQAEPSVRNLLEVDPFGDQPPRYIRALLYDYRFTTPEERRQSGGDWWSRNLLGAYNPVLERRD